jgi:Glycosyl-4,4'-diaponeurosporenoate acyltransferase|tara:strand:- start:127 stop:585 length:459 start_codon:yes stop_codon:yes gene_type:complete
VIILVYFLNAIVLTFVSWTIGLLINNAIKQRAFYKNLSHFSFIKNDFTNKILGLSIFGWIIKNSFFKVFNQKLKFKKGMSRKDLESIRSEMVYAEIGHLIGFLFILVFIFIKIGNGQYTYALLLLGFNIIFNLYPTLLQQYNKKRVDNILKR